MDFKTKIKRCGLKATSGRISLLEKLYTAKEPLSYEDLKESLSVDKATFYRTVTTFEDKGIVNSFEFPDKRRYYEFRKDNHAHFICVKCGCIECMEQNIVNIPDYQIETVVITGNCKVCCA